MPWSNQAPPAGEVLISLTIQLPGAVGCLELDRLPDEIVRPYRVTIGNLFDSAECGRFSSLEGAVRFCNALNQATTGAAFRSIMSNPASFYERPIPG